MYFSREQSKGQGKTLALLVANMPLIDSLTCAINRIYSPADEIAEDFMTKKYYGMASITLLCPKIGKRGPVVIILQLAFYFCLILYHLVALLRPLHQFFQCSLILFGQSLHYILLYMLMITLTIFLQFKRSEILRVHKAIATDFFDYSEPYVCNTQKLQAEIRKERLLLILVVLLCPMTVILFLLEHQINRYGTFDFNKLLTLSLNDNLPFAFGKYPYSTEEPFVCYATAALQILSIFLLMLVVMTGGYVFVTTSESLCLQMKILQQSLKKLEQRSLKMLETEFGIKPKLSDQKLYANTMFANCYSTCLKNNFKHYEEILRFFNDWKSIFSVVVCSCYIVGSIIIALNLVSISSDYMFQWRELPGSTLTSGAMCLGEVGFIFMLSAFGQKITDENEEARFQMYSIKWYDCNESVKRSIRIFLEVTKKPMVLMAGGVVPVNMDSFAKVMNSSYSYYNLVNVFNVAE